MPASSDLTLAAHICKLYCVQHCRQQLMVIDLTTRLYYSNKCWESKCALVPRLMLPSHGLFDNIFKYNSVNSMLLFAVYNIFWRYYMDYTIVEQVFVFTVRAYRGIKLISDFRSNVVFKMQFDGGFRLFDFFNILIV